MPGQYSKCSSCDKPKETGVIECSSCEQWLPYCCAGMSAIDDVIVFESVPFYCSQCLSTDGQQSSSCQDPTQCHYCHSQTGSRRKMTIHFSQCNRPFHLSCVKISRKHAKALPGWYYNACDPILNPPHPQKPTTMRTPLIDPTSIGTYIQSLRSVDHPIHRIPKAERPSFASGFSKLISKAISSNSLLEWHHLVCSPLSVLSLGPRSQGVSLTSSIRSRINAYLQSDSLPVPEASLGIAPPLPTKPHNDPAKNMKTGKPETI